MIKIDLATINDIAQVMEIKTEVLEFFNSLNDPQWNEYYPIEEDFLQDIESNSLFVARDENLVVGFMALGKDFPPLYKSLPFKAELTKSMVLHRFAVRKEYRSRGLASFMLNSAISICLQLNCYNIIADTHETNLPMQKFLEKFGFTYVSTFKFPEIKEGSFIAFEKPLN